MTPTLVMDQRILTLLSAMFTYLHVHIKRGSLFK